MAKKSIFLCGIIAAVCMSDNGAAMNQAEMSQDDSSAHSSQVKTATSSADTVPELLKSPQATSPQEETSLLVNASQVKPSMNAPTKKIMLAALLSMLGCPQDANNLVVGDLLLLSYALG
jgi:hypothetical protein